MNKIKQSTTSNAASKVISNVTCIKCQSSQIVTKKRGYHSKRMLKIFFSMLGIGGILSFLPAILFNLLIKTAGVNIPSIVREDILGILFGVGVLTLFLSFPAALIGGIIGSQTIVNICKDCGHQWNEDKKEG